MPMSLLSLQWLCERNVFETTVGVSLGYQTKNWVRTVFFGVMVALVVVDVVLVVVVVVIVLVYGILCGTKPNDSCPSNNSTVVGNNSTIIVAIVVTTLCARTDQHKSACVNFGSDATCQPPHDESARRDLEAILARTK